MSKGQTPSIKKYGGDQGINPNKLKIVVGSGADKSCIHPKKGAWRISMQTKRTLYIRGQRHSVGYRARRSSYDVNTLDLETFSQLFFQNYDST